MKKTSIPKIAERIAAPLESIASPQRLAILLVIGRGEACVCHLESALGWRQAYISQHLMELRKAGILTDRRQGRFIFYRLKNSSLLELVSAAAELSGITPQMVASLMDTGANPACECPHCTPALIHVESLKIV